MGDVNWKIKSAVTNPYCKKGRNSITEKSFSHNAQLKFYFSQIIFCHRTEIRIFSAIYKEFISSERSIFEIKLHYLYSIKYANVRNDFITLLDRVESHPVGMERFHLPPNEISTGLDSSIESSWPLHFLASNRDGFIG